MQGFNEITFSEVRYISATEAVEQFKQLSTLPGYYLRSSVMSEEIKKQYKMDLTVPKSHNSFYVRVWQPYLVWLNSADGAYYLINGNSRNTIIAEILLEGKLEVEPIPYMVIEQNLNQDQIARLQRDSNDTTRSHTTIERMRSIWDFVLRAVDNGIESATARKMAVDYFSISQQNISYAKKMCEYPLSADVLMMLDAKKVSVDTIIKAIEFAEAHKNSITVDEIFRQVLKSNYLDLSMKVSRKMIEKYRIEYERIFPVNVSDVSSAIDDRNREDRETAEKTLVIDERKERSERSDPESIENVEPVVVQDREISLSAIDNALKDVSYSPVKLRQLSSILGTIGSQLKDAEAQTLFGHLYSLAMHYSKSEDLSPQLLESLSVTLERITQKETTVSEATEANA